MLEATKVYVRSDFSLRNSECLDTFRNFFKFVSVYYIVNTNRLLCCGQRLIKNKPNLSCPRMRVSWQERPPCDVVGCAFGDNATIAKIKSEYL